MKNKSRRVHPLQVLREQRRLSLLILFLRGKKETTILRTLCCAACPIQAHPPPAGGGANPPPPPRGDAAMPLPLPAAFARSTNLPSCFFLAFLISALLDLASVSAIPSTISRMSSTSTRLGPCSSSISCRTDNSTCGGRYGRDFGSQKHAAQTRSF